MIARAVTSIARIVNSVVATSTAVLVPFREEIFSASQLGTPTQIAAALQQMQRHTAEVTLAARSLPLLGGVYFPNVALVPGQSTTISHRVSGGITVTFFVLRPSSSAAVWESSQSVSNGTITFQASASVTCDLWIFPAPIAGGKDSGIRSAPATVVPGASCCFNPELLFGPITDGAVANCQYLCDVSSGAITINLPTLAAFQGVEITHVNGSLASHSITINAPAGIALALPVPNNGSTASSFTLSHAEDFGSSLTWWNYGVSGVYSLN